MLVPVENLETSQELVRALTSEMQKDYESLQKTYLMPQKLRVSR
jgi:hypothetical protein